MPLALPFNGVTPLLFHVVLDAFPLWHPSVQRTVLVESFALCCEVPLRIASAPVAVALEPFACAGQEFPTAFLCRHADDRKFSFGIDAADVFAAEERKRSWLPAILTETWRQMNQRGASGIDGESSQEFECELETRSQGICARLRVGAYRAPPVRRVAIPKGPGKVGTRPLGMPTMCS
jgi:hypothetical protein